MSGKTKPTSDDAAGKPSKQDVDRSVQRADKVTAAMTEWSEGHKGSAYVASTPHGTVSVAQIRGGAGDNQIAHVDVYLTSPTGDPEPDFRIINPPSLVPDPAGTVVVGGVTFRDDPLAAIAHIVGRHGGTRQAGGRG